MTGCLNIVLAMKPVEGNFAENCLRHGCGALNIDGCRVGNETRTDEITERGFGSNFMDDNWNPSGRTYVKTVVGRWPANMILGHAEGCVLKGTKKVPGHTGYPNGAKGWGFHGGVGGRIPDGTRVEQPVAGYADADGNETVEDWDCVESCPVKRFPSPHSAGNKTITSCATTSGRVFSGGWKTQIKNPDYYADSGSAARFFKQVSEVKVEE